MRNEFGAFSIAALGTLLCLAGSVQAGDVSGALVGYWTFDSYTETTVDRPVGLPGGTHQGYFPDMSGGEQLAYTGIIDSKDYIPMDTGKFGNSLYSLSTNNAGNSQMTVIQHTETINFNQESFTVSFWEMSQYRNVAGGGWGDGRGRTQWFAKAPYMPADPDNVIVEGYGLNLTQNAFSLLGNKDGDNYGQELLSGAKYTYPSGSDADDSGEWCHWAITGTYNPGTDDYTVTTYLNGTAVDWNGGAGTTVAIANDIIDNDGDLTLGGFWRNNGYSNQRSLSWAMRDQTAGQVDGKGWMDDFAMLAIDLTAGEVAGTISVGNDAELTYSMAETQKLLDVFRDGAGEVTVGTRKWTYATGLTGVDGELTGSGLNFTLVLDGVTGVGLISGPDSVTGDADGDGDLDAADYIILKQNMGLSVGTAGEDGDFDKDGTVDWDDLQTLIGTMNAADETQTIPEPTTLFVILAAGLPALLKRRRSRS